MISVIDLSEEWLEGYQVGVGDALTGQNELEATVLELLACVRNGSVKGVAIATDGGGWVYRRPGTTLLGAVADMQWALARSLNDDE